jgi:hypothetical protein
MRPRLWEHVEVSVRVAAEAGAEEFRVLEPINGQRREQIQGVDRSTAERRFEITASRRSETATAQVGGVCVGGIVWSSILGADGW